MTGVTDTPTRTRGYGRPIRAVRWPAWAIALLDAVVVVVFAFVGRASHGGVGGVVDTARVAWPFLVALAVGWVIAYGVHRSAPRTVGGGVIVWLITLAGGVLLRGVTGGGTHWSFVLVSAIFLGLTLVGWRLIAARRR